MAAISESRGRKLYRELTKKYDFEEHEMALLGLIVDQLDQLDRVDALDAIVRREGLMRGDRVHPAAQESRMVALSVGRLLATLRIPDEDAEDVRPQRRGALRGVYKGGGVA